MWCEFALFELKIQAKWCVNGAKEEEKIDKWKKMVKMEMKKSF